MSPREPTIRDVASGVVLIDTRMADLDEFNAVYLLTGSEPTLVETGPAADAPVVLAALAQLGLGAGDLAHLVVTHIHLDHAGGAGTLLARLRGRRRLGARAWGAAPRRPHEAGGLDRTHVRRGPDAGPLRQHGTRWTAPGSAWSSTGTGSRSGTDPSTSSTRPGTPRTTLALHDDATGALFTGEAIGSHLPWADVLRPALPPPEVDVEAALASIDAIRARGATTLMTSHFGPIDDAEEGCDRGAARIVEWSDAVRRRLDAHPDADADELTDLLRGRGGRRSPRGRRRADRPRALRRHRLDPDERRRPGSLLAETPGGGGRSLGRGRAG